VTTLQRSTGPLIDALQAVLAERQAVLTGPDTRAARDRGAALGLRAAGLLRQIERLYPPGGALEDQAAAPGEFDRFLNHGGAERLAG
jgi:hypothetical protein